MKSIDGEFLMNPFRPPLENKKGFYFAFSVFLIVLSLALFEILIFKYIPPYDNLARVYSFFSLGTKVFKLSSFTATSGKKYFFNIERDAINSSIDFEYKPDFPGNIKKDAKSVIHFSLITMKNGREGIIRYLLSGQVDFWARRNVLHKGKWYISKIVKNVENNSWNVIQINPLADYNAEVVRLGGQPFLPGGVRTISGNMATMSVASAKNVTLEPSFRKLDQFNFLSLPRISVVK